MLPTDRLRFDIIAERLLHSQGYAPAHYGDDAAAAIAGFDRDTAAGRWPCLFGPSTTSGEKDAEEFREPGEAAASSQPYQQIEVITPGAAPPLEQLERELFELEGSLHDAAWLLEHDKSELVASLARLVPGFRHRETGTSLDRKL
jgi:hypothetical protein